MRVVRDCGSSYRGHSERGCGCEMETADAREREYGGAALEGSGRGSATVMAIVVKRRSERREE
jgi:hypothetical protein